MNIENKKVTVIGLGNSGLNAAIALDNIGAFVRVTERADNADVRKNIERLEHRDIEIEIGAHTRGFVQSSELVVVSPGVEDASPPVRWAEELGIPVISEMELGFRLCKGRIIGITGTNGKSTVTALIGEILKEAGFKTVVCGNIGNALCGEIEGITKDHWVVLEVSSFQLERTADFRPHIAVILNITDDHQDRYRSLKRYFDEKMKIFKNQDAGDFLVLNHDAPNLRELTAQKAKPKAKTYFYSRTNEKVSAFIKDAKIICAFHGRQEEICGISDIRIKGGHNHENALASSLVAIIAGARPDSIRDALKRFRGLSHRFETVEIVNGVEFVDDSKSTTVDSTLRALESSAKPVMLIAGGRDKNSDYSAVRDIVRRKVKGLMLIGEAKYRIQEALGELTRVHEAGTLEEAVAESFKLAQDGDMVLLSPMCSSFDMFKDYKHRGEAFREAVREIKNQKSKFKIVESLKRP